MKIAKTIAEVRNFVKEQKSAGLTVGFVPTMGYLHDGHKSLIVRSAAENDVTVVSIFVNPTQFGENEDLSTYPRDFEADKVLCQCAGADLIFAPEVEEMYDKSSLTFVEVQELTKGLCGKSRPTHFNGVCTVVAKLFNIVAPNKAYFGQKDAQQLAVIRCMVKDLDFDIQIVGCPIIREEDGLAKSSRNSYLSQEERSAATVLSKAIFKGEAMIEAGETSAEKIKSAMIELINTESLATIDYVEITDAITLEPIELIQKEVLVAVAVFIGKTRLIDNFIVKIGEN